MIWSMVGIITHFFTPLLMVITVKRTMMKSVRYASRVRAQYTVVPKPSLLPVVRPSKRGERECKAGERVLFA